MDRTVWAGLIVHLQVERVQMAFNRWKERVNGYVLLFYDDYPPFEFESSDGAPDTAE